jgi:hypothetical protein
MYQLLPSCAGFMMRFFMKTRGCGTLNIAVRLILSEYRAARYPGDGSSPVVADDERF